MGNDRDTRDTKEVKEVKEAKATTYLKGTLTNLDIATNYRDAKFYIALPAVTAAFSYWVVALKPEEVSINIGRVVSAFYRYTSGFFKDPIWPEEFTYDRLSDIFTEEQFEMVPEILELNRLEPEFICLGALSRNVFFMVLRECITQR